MWFLKNYSSKRKGRSKSLFLSIYTRLKLFRLFRGVASPERSSSEKPTSFLMDFSNNGKDSLTDRIPRGAGLRKHRPPRLVNLDMFDIKIGFYLCSQRSLVYFPFLWINRIESVLFQKSTSDVSGSERYFRGIKHCFFLYCQLY